MHRFDLWRISGKNHAFATRKLSIVYSLLKRDFVLRTSSKSQNQPLISISFTKAASGDQAKALCEGFVEEARRHVTRVETGTFAAYMQVELVGDGPFTLILEDR